MIHIRVHLQGEEEGEEKCLLPACTYTGTALDTLHVLWGCVVWSVSDESCVRESVLLEFIRVCLVKGVQTRTSAAFIKITDIWCCPDKCRGPGLPVSPPLFILNERETMIRVDCRTRCSAKLTLIECRGNLDWYGHIHVTRHIMERR